MTRRAEKPVQSIFRDDLAYQRESTDSDAESHQATKSTRGEILRLQSVSKQKIFISNITLQTKKLLTHDLFLFQLPLSALIIHLRSYREKTVGRLYEEHFVLPILKIYG